MSDRLERLSRGDRFSVDPGAIERELSAIWREAGKTNGPDTQLVTRACLWNVVVHAELHEGREGADGADRLAEVVQELPEYIATRAIVLRTEPAKDDGQELDSWLSANCRLSPDGGKMVCSEEVTVAAYGGGDAHLRGLMPTLLVPDVPSAAVFAGVPGRGLVGATLVDVADRLIVDVDHSREPDALRQIDGVARKPPLGTMDLGWLAQSGLRAAIAELFEPPVPDDAWQSVSQVTIKANKEALASAKMIGAWIGSTLGGHSPTAKGEGSWALKTSPGKSLRLRIVDDDSGCATGIGEVSMSGGSRAQSVRFIGDRRWEIAPDSLPSRVTVIDVASRAELLSMALRSRAKDQAFATAVALAGQL